MQKSFSTNGTEGHWSIPDFESVHTTFGIPIHQLADPDLSGWGAAHQESSRNMVEYYSAHEIVRDPAWRDRHPGGIGFLPVERTVPSDAQSTPDRADLSFNPRFRLVIARPAANSLE